MGFLSVGREEGVKTEGKLFYFLECICVKVFLESFLSLFCSKKCNWRNKFFLIETQSGLVMLSFASRIGEIPFLC